MLVSEYKKNVEREEEEKIVSQQTNVVTLGVKPPPHSLTHH